MIANLHNRRNVYLHPVSYYFENNLQPTAFNIILDFCKIKETHIFTNYCCYDHIFNKASYFKKVVIAYWNTLTHFTHYKYERFRDVWRTIFLYKRYPWKLFTKIFNNFHSEIHVLLLTNLIITYNSWHSRQKKKNIFKDLSPYNLLTLFTLDNHNIGAYIWLSNWPLQYNIFVSSHPYIHKKKVKKNLTNWEKKIFFSHLDVSTSTVSAKSSLFERRRMDNKNLQRFYSSSSFSWREMTLKKL